jgi:hypothetical protein
MPTGFCSAMVVAACIAECPPVAEIRETSERRRGGTIVAAGVSRDPARSCLLLVGEVSASCTRKSPPGYAPTTGAMRDGSVMRI